MSKFLRKDVTPVLLGVILCFMLFIVPAWKIGVFDPIPYKDVSVTHVDAHAGEVVIHANFWKNGCEVKKVVAVGVDLGETSPPLLWRDLDGRSKQSGTYDRVAGRNTLRIAVELGDRRYDEIQISTRHNCDGQRIDKVFATVPVPNLEGEG